MAKQKQEVATVEENGPPAELMDQYAQDAGAGVSQKAEDNIVPMATVLQALSPQVDRRNPAYVEDAQPGSILLKNCDPPVVDGEEGFLFQPCYFDRYWVEWVPRDQGGGFVARHKNRPADAIDEEDGRRTLTKTPGGNQLIDTRYHSGYALINGVLMPLVIPFSSTGHQVSRSWQTMMNQVRVGPNQVVAPSYAKFYRLRTVQKKNAAGTWFMFDVSHGHWATKSEYDLGKALHDSFQAGEKEIGEEPQEAKTF